MNKQLDRRYFLIMTTLLILLVVVSTMALCLGRYQLSPDMALAMLGSRLLDRSAIFPAMEQHVLFQIRIPRIVLAGLVGTGLSLSGAAMQGTFQNPLVSPDLLGVCAGSGFGAALGILLFPEHPLLMNLLSFSMGIGSVLLVFFMAHKKSQGQMLSLVLSGIIVSSIFNALVSLIKYTADTSEKLPAITFFLMGSFANAAPAQIKIAALPIVLGCLGLLLLRWKINLLSLGDEDAATLGIDPRRTRWAIILLATLITAACVTISGVIGWIGLVIPHIARKLVGVNHGRLLPASALLGAAFMILADSMARNLTAAEIPIGILTALIGAPFFAVIYHHTKGGH